MQGFNYRKAENGENCGNCYMGIRHLTRGLLCGYTDAPTLCDHRCGLYIRQQEKEKIEQEGQEELF